MITREGAYVDWTAPKSAVPVLFYRLQWLPSDAEEDAVPSEATFSSAQLSTALTGLSPGTSYDVRLQAWTDAVLPSACTSGENSLCSQFSEVANFTTATTAAQWHLAVSGSYLYGDGSVGLPFPMDLQGAIDREEVRNGRQPS